MKLNFKIFILSVIFCCNLLLLFACDLSNSSNLPILTTTFDGKTISFYDERTIEYLNLQTENECANFLKKYKGQTFDSHISYDISWSGQNSPYTVIFSRDNDFKNIYLQKTAKYNMISITANDYFIAGTYYYKIQDSKGKISKTDSFSTDSTI